MIALYELSEKRIKNFQSIPGGVGQHFPPCRLAFFAHSRGN